MAGSVLVKRHTAKRGAVASAARLLKQRLHDVRHRIEPAARDWKKSGEPVHKLRVAARRGVAAIDLLEPLLPRRKAHRMRRLLQRMRRACDAARDRDVLIARIEKHRAGRQAAWLRPLRRQRHHDQRSIVAIHDDWLPSGRIERRIKKLLARVCWGRRDATGSEPGFGTFIRRQLRRPALRFQNALVRSPTNGKLDMSGKTLHRLRIRGKRLRYALELAGDAVPPRQRRKLETMLRQLQDHLGAIHDAAMAREALRARLAATKKASDAAQLKKLLAAEEKAIATARDAFVHWRTSQRWTGPRSVLRRLCKSV